MEGIVNAWTSLRHWIGAKRAALRLCVRMTVAGLLAYALAILFGLPQGYWAVFSAIIIMQASVGGSVKAAIDRLIGTLGGAIAGGVVAFFVPHNDPISLGIALVIALAPLTLVAAINPNYRIAPLTAVIVLLTPGAQQLGPVGSAFYPGDNARQRDRPRRRIVADAGARPRARHQHRRPHGQLPRRPAARLACGA
jgi:uncharacterized membrane protein YccC